ncbi:MAG TPA: MATE family efflux transporter [Methanospirillum sp.]|uniref:MATE family efflux transporter n=1 Tax=Methanospirillum sp. TaxID=45200 RepID=UPI002B824399|nr:MATE family efflux transporter [Methanospirillum sp.]HOJ95238.1 MATE family efflux transporter [Methanospirillum sp.]HPP77488.1 MATE family efflux transporter [Methanospirillum sp.]
MKQNPIANHINTPTGEKEETVGVSLLLGEPEKAIRKLSGPLIIAMLLYSTYNIVNAIWVAGLGSDALAAVGFISPLFLVLVGLGNGLAAGTTSVIARRIGAGDLAGANNAAVHAILLTGIISVIITFPLIIWTTDIALLFGAGKTAGLCGEYGRVIFGSTVLLLLTSVGSAILRAEGDTKRSMYLIALSALMNMVLDPLLIYTAGLGISGAAWGMVISQIFVMIVLIYWFFGKKDTYVTVSRRSYVYQKQTMQDILGVGIPASLEFFLMSFLAIIINGLLVSVAGTDAVAVYAAGWRVVIFAIIPLAAIGTSVISVAGAAFGGRRYEKLPIIHNYSVKTGLMVAISLSILTWLFSYQIASIFTYSPESIHLAPSIAAFLATMCFFYPFVPPGIMSGSLFQGVGKGMTSLILNVFRNLLFIAVCAYLFGIILGYGEHGIWWGIVAGDIMGGTLAYIWAKIYLSRLLRYQ